MTEHVEYCIFLQKDVKPLAYHDHLEYMNHDRCGIRFELSGSYSCSRPPQHEGAHESYNVSPGMGMARWYTQL